ncbi:MAG: response regulator [Pseudomonadota bacterium]
MDKFKVLLVDDEEEFVKSLSERLQIRELDAETAFDGEQALQLVSDEVPDVMVLDLRMPGIDGMEVLRRVKKKYPEVQVVILTGHGTDKDETQAKKLGAYAYLQKPVDLDTLVETLKRAYRNKLENTMAAAAFAEAGEFDSAREMIKDKKKK